MGGGRVFVTGASGKLGQAVVEELLAHEYEVVGADLASPPRGEVAHSPGGGNRAFQFAQIDLVDVDQVAGAMSGAQAVIHLGAIPGPNRVADEVVFGNNTRATFAVIARPSAD